MSEQDKSTALQLLDALLTNIYESVRGFKKAAELIDNDTLEQYFLEKANRRSVFATELITAMRTLGGGIISKDSDPKIIGMLHRAWMNINATFSENNKNAILRECKRGDESFLEDYRTVLKTPGLPSSVKNVLEQQENELIKGIEAFKELQWMKVGNE